MEAKRQKTDRRQSPPREKADGKTNPRASGEAPNVPPDVAKHRQCPSCYNGLGGVGNVYSTERNKSYYKCKTCGHTWTATVRREVVKVEHRTVELETRDARGE